MRGLNNKGILSAALKCDLFLGSYSGYGTYPGAGTTGQKPPKPGKARSMDMSIGLNEDVKLAYTFPKNIFKLYQHMLDLMK